jgi:hypothetical protein
LGRAVGRSTLALVEAINGFNDLLPGFVLSKPNTQTSDLELVDEKIYPMRPSQKAETAVPEYEQIDWEAEQNQGQRERWHGFKSR